MNKIVLVTLSMFLWLPMACTVGETGELVKKQPNGNKPTNSVIFTYNNNTVNVSVPGGFTIFNGDVVKNCGGGTYALDIHNDTKEEIAVSLSINEEECDSCRRASFKPRSLIIIKPGERNSVYADLGWCWNTNVYVSN